MSSQYSEMMGSFVRTGNYPLEAYYIFPTEKALKEFYSDKLNATTIHKGLLRIVENDGTGNQGLYWVTKKLTNDELEFTKLISGTNIESIFEQLDSLETRLTEEINNRKEQDTAIWGTDDTSNLPRELNSIVKLVSVIQDIKKEIVDIHSELIDSDDSIYKSLKTEVKALAGTQEYDIVEYLKTLPYKSLTEVSVALNKFLNEVDETSNQINTLPELKFFLEGYNDKQKLRHVLMDLQAEILGNPLPTQDFRTLRAIEDFVRILKADSQNTDRNLQTEINQTQIGVGLNSDGSYSADQETYYLKDATSIMNALKILDALMFEAISGITIDPDNKDVVDLAVRKELEGYIISAKLKLSNQLGNDLIKKEDGLYFNIDSTYKDGVLSLYVNDKLIAQHILGLSSLVDTAKYDPDLEAIVIVFKLLNGDKQTITIPVGGIIREWDVDNNQPGKVVELVRTVVVDGQDTLSADVRLWSDNSNILRKYGNTLGVEGTTDNITHNGETLKVFLTELRNTVIANNTTVNNKIDSEISRAKDKEADLESNIAKVRTDLSKDIEDANDAIADVNNAVKSEYNRAVAAENSLKTQVEDLKTADSEIRQVNELQTTKLSSLEKALADANHAVELEEKRAEGEESKINQRITSLEGEVSGVSQKLSDLDSDIKDVLVAMAGKVDRTEINNLIEPAITSQVATLTTKINENATNISKLDASVSKDLADMSKDIIEVSKAIDTKIGSVQLQKVNDLTWNLLVDGANIGQISVPEDQFLESVTVVNGTTLRFVFKTKTGTVTTDINIEDIILNALSDLETKVNTKAPIDSPTFTGIPQVETSPDATDSSQRIPSTNWVRARIQEEIAKVSVNNFYTKAEVLELLSGKADLIDGKVPESQLPKLYIIEVE